MIYITGDIHGTISPIFKLCRKINPTESDTVIILGDVGANYSLDSRDVYFKRQLSEFKPTFFCIHGNHECRPQNIPGYKEKDWNGGKVLYQDEFPKILFSVDGEIFDLNGIKCLVIGGAYSVDKYFSLQCGSKWFEDEQPSDEIKSKVMKQIENNNIDIIFSHTCPKKYIPTECFYQVLTNQRLITVRKNGLIL